MSACNRDFREWEGFAKKLAAKYVKPGVDLEDLEQEAVLALLEELPKFSADLGVSLRVFLGRGIRNRLASLYRKTLNLVQLEQYWEVKHVSGDRELNVRASSREQAEAVMRAQPTNYVDAKHVKVLTQIGPSLDDEFESPTDDADMLLHETIGERPAQEWMISLNSRFETLKTVPVSEKKASELETILSMRRDGFTFSQIGERLGKDLCAVQKILYRAQRRAKEQAA